MVFFDLVSAGIAIGMTTDPRGGEDLLPALRERWGKDLPGKAENKAVWNLEPIVQTKGGKKGNMRRVVPGC